MPAAAVGRGLDLHAVEQIVAQRVERWLIVPADRIAGAADAVGQLELVGAAAAMMHQLNAVPSARLNRSMHRRQAARSYHRQRPTALRSGHARRPGRLAVCTADRARAGQDRAARGPAPGLGRWPVGAGGTPRGQTKKAISASTGSATSAIRARGLASSAQPRCWGRLDGRLELIGQRRRQPCVAQRAAQRLLDGDAQRLPGMLGGAAGRAERQVAANRRIVMQRRIVERERRARRAAGLGRTGAVERSRGDRLE